MLSSLSSLCLALSRTLQKNSWRAHCKSELARLRGLWAPGTLPPLPVWPAAAAISSRSSYCQGRGTPVPLVCLVLCLVAGQHLATPPTHHHSTPCPLLLHLIYSILFYESKQTVSHLPVTSCNYFIHGLSSYCLGCVAIVIIWLCILYWGIAFWAT